MRKVLLYLSALVCCSTNVQAIEGPQSMTTGIVIGTGGFPHFNPQAGGGKLVAFKNYRLVAKTYTEYNGTWFQPVDSVAYKYSPGRGGLIDADQPNYDESLLFDDAITYYYNAGVSGYDNKLFRKQTFNDSNKVLSLTYATWRTTSGAWKDSARYQYTYITGTTKIKESMFQLWVGGTWSHDVPSVLTYSGNNVVAVSSNSYNASYVYDSKNNIISVVDKVAIHGTGILNYNERKTYTYDSNNEVESYVLERWNNNTYNWDKTERYEYLYTAGNVTQSIKYIWNNNRWETFSKQLFTYNNNNDKTSEITQLWDALSSSFVNSNKTIYNYNNIGLLESMTTQKWDAAGYWKYADGNTQTRYYYEYYYTTSVGSIAAAEPLNIYPVPAKDQLTISLGSKGNEHIALSVLNMNGAVVKQWDTENTTTTADISTLPNGTYALYARNEMGETRTSKFTIAR